MDKSLRELILENLREFSTEERPIYLAGGAIRDQLLGLPIHDLDFVMPGETLAVAREAAKKLGGALYILDEERQTIRVVLEPGERAGAPAENIYLDFSVLRAADIAADLQLRDFSINAMAYDLKQPNRLLDPTGGLADLREKRIRACGATSLRDDPARVLRAVRQGIKYGFRIDPETFQLMRSAAGSLTEISAERVRDELFRMLDGPRVSLAMRILDRCGALSFVLPELDNLKGVQQTAPHISDVWEHTLAVLQHLEQILAPLVGQYQEETVADLSVGSAVLWLGRFREAFYRHFSSVYVPERTVRSLLFFAALYHDVSKPETREEMSTGKVRFLQHPEKGAGVAAERARKLALSTNEIERISTVVRQHMRVHFLTEAVHSRAGAPLSRRVIYRYFKDTDQAGVDICLFSLADLRGTYGVTLPQSLWETELAVCRNLLEAYWEHTDEVISPPRYLNGHVLMEMFALRPGKRIGQILDAIREAQAAGEISSREAAIEFAQKYLKMQVNGVSFSTTDKGFEDVEGEE